MERNVKVGPIHTIKAFGKERESVIKKHPSLLATFVIHGVDIETLGMEPHIYIGKGLSGDTSSLANSTTMARDLTPRGCPLVANHLLDPLGLGNRLLTNPKTTE